MKAKLLVIFTVLALTLALPHPAAATITTFDLTLNNVGGQGITFTFKFDTSAEIVGLKTIPADTLYFTGDSTGTSGGTFVRFDKITYGTAGITLSSFVSDSAAWQTTTNGNFHTDGFGDGLGAIEDDNPGTHTTPIGSYWTFSGPLSGPIGAHAVFASGCTFWASTSPSFNGNTTSNTGGESGACAGGVLTPEPSSLVLFGGGLLGLAAVIRRRPNRWPAVWTARA